MARDPQVASKTHHCPKSSKGGCRFNKKLKYCTEHNMKCQGEGCKWIHLKNQECSRCTNKRAYAEKRIEEEEEEG